MDPTAAVLAVHQLRQQLSLARAAAAELESWCAAPPRVGPDDWAGPAAQAHELALARLREQLTGASHDADAWVAQTARALAVIESGLP